MEDAAKITVAIIFAGLFLALVNGGWTGPNGALDWFKAKFLGQPPGSTPTATGGSLMPGVGTSLGTAAGTLSAPPPTASSSANRSRTAQHSGTNLGGFRP